MSGRTPWAERIIILKRIWTKIKQWLYRPPNRHLTEQQRQAQREDLEAIWADMLADLEHNRKCRAGEDGLTEDDLLDL